jgi:hypothetical protein
MILGKKLKLRNPPKTLEDTSTEYQLKKGYLKGSNMFKGVLEFMNNRVKPKKQGREEKELNETELEQEFLQKKKKVNPILHKSEKCFERLGFVGDTKMTRMTPRELSQQNLFLSKSKINLTVPNAYKDNSKSGFLNISRKEYNKL